MILAVSHTLCSSELLPGEKETTLSAIATVQFCACGDMQTSLLVSVFLFCFSQVLMKDYVFMWLFAYFGSIQ